MRMNSIDRRAMLLDCALGLAEEEGYMNVTQRLIARLAGVSLPTLVKHLGTMEETRTLVVKEAIKRKNLPIILQAMIAGDKQVHNLDPQIKHMAIEQLR